MYRIALDQFPGTEQQIRFRTGLLEELIHAGSSLNVIILVDLGKRSAGHLLESTAHNLWKKGLSRRQNFGDVISQHNARVGMIEQKTPIRRRKK